MGVWCWEEQEGRKRSREREGAGGRGGEGEEKEGAGGGGCRRWPLVRKKKLEGEEFVGEFGYLSLVL